MHIRALRIGLVLCTLVVLGKPTTAPKHLNNMVAQPKTVQAKAEVITQPVKEKTPQVAEEPKPVAEERPAPQPPVVVAQALPTDKTELMRLAGIPESDYSHVDYIVSHESSWNYQAVNSIGATGLCQALPASKMATEGEDYLTNPVTQLKWCAKYANQRYGSWYSAFAFWTSNRWW